MAETSASQATSRPLEDLDDWESVHHQDGDRGENGQKSTFRDYRENVRPGVREF